MASPEARQILIKDFGYQPVDIESKSGYSRAVKETIVKLENSKPNDPRISILQDAIRPSKKRTTKKESTKKESTKKESTKKESTQPKKTKDDAVKFIRGKGTPEPVEPTPPPIPKFGGAKTGAALTSISQTVNAIKKLVTSQNKFEKDKADDTREEREKKKRSMKENLMEGGKKMYDKVAGTFGKVLEPAKGIFESIFNFIKLFFLGSAFMKILDWFGNPANKDKIQSIFRFLKDFWPVIAAGVIALMGPIPTFVASIALAFEFVPKIINFVKSIFGLNKDVDKEIKNQEKGLTDENTGDDTTITTTTRGPTTAFAEDAEGNEITDLNERERISQEAREALPMNKGGEVPGQGDKDTVPAMLTPGEFVLTKDAVNQIGADTLYNMNAAAGGVGKSNDVPRGPSGKPKKKKSTVQTMMDMGKLNPINNISKSMNNNTFDSMSSSSDVTNNQSNVTNNIAEITNMSGGGMTKNMSYMGGGGMTKNTSYMNSGGMVTNNVDGTSNVQYMKFGGMVKNFISNSPQARFLKFAGNQISKTPQARLLRFAAKQIKKLPVKPPAAKALKALKALGMKNTPPPPMAPEGADTSVNDIPRFSVVASGGRAKEQTLGIRR